jgi:hypothetical protein
VTAHWLQNTVLDKIIGFIGISVTLSLNYNQYSAITDLHNLQFTVTRTLRISVFTSHILVTELNSLTVTKSSIHTLCLHRPTSNSSSTTNFLWLSPTDTWAQLSSLDFVLICTRLIYSQLQTHNTASSIVMWCLCWGYHVITFQPVHWLTDYCLATSS